MKKSTLIVILSGFGVVIVGLVVTIVLLLNRQPSGVSDDSRGSLGIGYASEGVVALDEETLQEAVDKSMMSGRVGLWYQNDAYSDDGENFRCFLGNSTLNVYDMFFDMYLDDEMTEEIFLSQLLRPGERFEKIQLNRKLASGSYRVPTAFTLVDTAEDGTQEIRGQVVVTLDLHVG